MKIQDDEVNLCPEELPDGLVDYIREEMLPTDNVLIYRHGNTRGTCFLCGKDVKAQPGQRFRKNEAGRCPNCGRWVQFYNFGGTAFKCDYVDNVATIQKGTDGETVFIRHWHVTRDSSAQWERIDKCLEEICRYAIRGNRVAKWQLEAKEAYWMNHYRYRLDHWVRTNDLSRINDGGYWFYRPENWRDIFAGTSLQYCDLEGYMNYQYRDQYGRENKNVIRFLSEWARYPALEKFWKAGYCRLVEERLNYDSNGHKPIVWQRKSIKTAIKVPYRLLKLREPNAWDHETLQKATDLWKCVGVGQFKETDIPALLEWRGDVRYLKRAWGHASAKKIIRYAEAHTVQMQTYQDYLEECVTLALDLDDESVLFPADLYAAHQRTISMVRHKANELEREKFAEVSRKLQKHAWENGEYLIRPAASQEELIAEGKALHHCVGGYASRMAKGETAIFLIRKKEEPDKPFYTLEWKNKQVVQCRTTNNQTYTLDESVSAFVSDWVKRMTPATKKSVV